MKHIMHFQQFTWQSGMRTFVVIAICVHAHFVVIQQSRRDSVVAAEVSSYISSPDTPFGAQGENFEAVQTLAAREISIGAVTLFHHKFIEKCMPSLPDEVQLQYDGPLRIDTGRNKQKIDGVGIDLAYAGQSSPTQVTSRFGCQRVKHLCRLLSVGLKNKTYSLMSISWIRSSIDESLPELGKQSVRQILVKLNDKPAK